LICIIIYKQFVFKSASDQYTKRVCGLDDVIHREVYYMYTLKKIIKGSLHSFLYGLCTRCIALALRIFIK